jgi:hypothetical protein
MITGAFAGPIGLVSATPNPTEQPSAVIARTDGWRSDLDVLVREVQRQHYVYRRAALPQAFVAGLGRLKARVAEFSDERMPAEANRLMVLLGDGHTYVLPAAAGKVPGRWLPLHLYWFPDGMYVIDASDDYAELVGQRVERLGALTATRALADVASFVPKDNTMGVRWMGPFALRFFGVLDALGAGATDHVGIWTRDGNQTRARDVRFDAVRDLRGIPKLVPSKRAGAPPPPLYLRDVDRAYWWTTLEPHVVYLQFNQVRDAPQEALSRSVQRLEQSLVDQGTTALIVDVRHNNGGDATLLDPLVDAIIRFERRRRLNRVVVITGRNTFSAAQIFIARLDASTQARFAGEPSASRPNFVGEENPIVLPWSGAIASISDRLHEQIPGDRRRWIGVDWPVVLTAADYFANRDPVLEKVLARLGLTAADPRRANQSALKSVATRPEDIAAR